MPADRPALREAAARSGGGGARGLLTDGGPGAGGAPKARTAVPAKPRVRDVTPRGQRSQEQETDRSAPRHQRPRQAVGASLGQAATHRGQGKPDPQAVDHVKSPQHAGQRLEQSAREVVDHIGEREDRVGQMQRTDGQPFREATEIEARGTKLGAE
jgi:hypothetical protein